MHIPTMSCWRKTFASGDISVASRLDSNGEVGASCLWLTPLRRLFVRRNPLAILYGCNMQGRFGAAIALAVVSYWLPWVSRDWRIALACAFGALALVQVVLRFTSTKIHPC